MNQPGTGTDGQAAAGERHGSTGLLPGALGQFSITMQSISFVGPAFSALLLFQVVAGFAGVSVAFAFAIAGVIILMLAVSLGTLAARLPSAGGYFTYVTRAVSPRAGWLLSWVFLIYAPIAPGFIVAYTGYVCEQALQADYGFTLPWWVVLVAVVALVTVVVYRGIQLSARTLVVLGVIEAVVVLTLAVWGLAAPGPGGFSLAPLSPASAPSFHGLYLAVVFSLFAFAGWEGSVPLAEESRRPARAVPIGLISSVLFIVALFVFTSWGLMVGWGTRALPSLVTSAQAPPLVLAHRYLGAAWVLVLVALLNSVICASIASFNTVTRMWFAMARSGLVPSWLGHVNQRYRTPSYGVATQALLVLVVGLGFGLWLGPLNSFLTLSLLTTLALAFIYAAGNLGVAMFHARERELEFRPIVHGLFPLLTTAAVLWVAYKSLNPLPPSPIRWGALAGGVWLTLGVLILIARSSRGPADWAADARLAMHERAGLNPSREPT